MVVMSPYFCLTVSVNCQNNQQQILQTLDAQTASTLDDSKVFSMPAKHNACVGFKMIADSEDRSKKVSCL